MKIREITAKTVTVEITPEEISTLFLSLARQRDALRHSLKEQDLSPDDKIKTEFEAQRVNQLITVLASLPFGI